MYKFYLSKLYDFIFASEYALASSSSYMPMGVINETRLNKTDINLETFHCKVRNGDTNA